MALDLSSPPPLGRTRLHPFPGWLAALGPGIVWMALAQGSGELIWWPYLTAKYGLGFLVLLTPACLVQYPVTYAIGRYSMLTGESVWRGFARVHPAFCFVLWLLMVVAFLWFGAFASAGGTALARLLDWPPLDDRGRSLFWASVTIAVFAFALLRGERIVQLLQLRGRMILLRIGLDRAGCEPCPVGRKRAGDRPVRRRGRLDIVHAGTG